MSETAARSKRPTGAAKVSRDSALVADRARGIGWLTLSAKYNLTARQCQNIWNERERLELPGQGDPRSAIRDVEAFFEAAIEELAVLAAETNNDSIRLGAIKARVEVQKRMLQLKRCYGLVPWDLQQIRTETDLAELAQRLAPFVDRLGLGEEDRRDLEQIIACEPGRNTWLRAPADKPAKHSHPGPAARKQNGGARSC